MITRRIFFLIITIACISCAIKKLDKEIHPLGNFTEVEYDFFNSISHQTEISYYWKWPFHAKFGGIEPTSYSWLRNPVNLRTAFNVYASIGLENFVTREQYFSKNEGWCCSQWQNISLHKLIRKFLESDTTGTGNDYYSKFWQRRRVEKNLVETYQILHEIDQFYNYNVKPIAHKTDIVMKNLVSYDIQLIQADSNTYPDVALDYFNYLKNAGLNYSAYKLMFHNDKINFSKHIRDSLITTIAHDTITIDQWKYLNDNSDGWIGGYSYPDPTKYYGP